MRRRVRGETMARRLGFRSSSDATGFSRQMTIVLRSIFDWSFVLMLDRRSFALYCRSHEGRYP
ncbi:hypothetical protein Tsubulata_049890 [Turnera subulata]|uniref:Uncharacterized protein n=1 Tax=Turnera subulata TaxID=218843 RepID=A0A9Q0JLV3_9ROSI|nr:hypothetical protein Tsubulata_049890 [Turnera subulata]